MKTNLELIYTALLKLKEMEMSFEEAIEAATTDTELFILDDIKIIRDFLVDVKLLEFNPKTRCKGVEYTDNNFSYSYEKILEDCINDNLTEDCIKMIEKEDLKKYLLQEYNKI